MDKRPKRILPVPFLLVLVALLVLLLLCFGPWIGFSACWAEPTAAQSSCLTALSYAWTSILGALLGLLLGRTAN